MRAQAAKLARHAARVEVFLGENNLLDFAQAERISRYYEAMGAPGVRIFERSSGTR
jgi:hypothetical protein